MLKYEHANSKCTGTKLEVRAECPDVNDGVGRFIFTIVPQLTPSYMTPSKVIHAEFGGACAHIALTPPKVAHLLVMAEGDMASANRGKGIGEITDEYFSIVYFDREEDGKFYAMHIITQYSGEPGAKRDLRIRLSPTEVMSMCTAIKSAMGIVAFGGGTVA